jgi:hypothetical protein
MIRRHVKAYLILGLFFLSLGGLGLHWPYHNPADQTYGIVPAVAGAISVVLIPLLFLFRRTLHLAHLVNGFVAIIGMVTMTHFSLVARPLYADVAIVMVKFFLGRSIFELEAYRNLDTAPTAAGWRFFRYPNMGFWYVHFVLISVVYALGQLLWRP